MRKAPSFLLHDGSAQAIRVVMGWVMVMPFDAVAVDPHYTGYTHREPESFPVCPGKLAGSFTPDNYCLNATLAIVIGEQIPDPNYRNLCHNSIKRTFVHENSSS